MEIINVNETTPGNNARLCTSDALMEPHLTGGGAGLIGPEISTPEIGCNWDYE